MRATKILRRSILVVAMLVLAPMLSPISATVASAQAPPSEDPGPGFAIVTVTGSEFVDGLGLSADATDVVGTEVRILAISTLRGVRDSGLPQWAQLEELNEAGFGSWAEVPDHKLDDPIAPININLDMVTDITPEVEEIRAGGPYLSTRGACTKWRNGSVSVDETIDGSTSRDIGIPRLPDEFTGTVGVDLSAELRIVGNVSYRYKKVRNICSITAGIVTLGSEGILLGYLAAQIPYKWEVLESNLAVRLEVDGNLGVGAKLAYTYTDQLWRLTPNIDIWDQTITQPLYGVMSLEIDLDLDLDFALTFEATVGVTGTGEFAQDWRVTGSAEVAWHCLRNDCEMVSSDTDLNFVNGGPIRTQKFLDVKLIPSADLNLDIDIDVAVAGVKFLDLAKGAFGIVAQLPARYYWTDGHNCSDADGDGEFERVQTQFVDLNFEIFGYVRGSLFDAGFARFLPFNLPDFILDEKKPLYRFNVIIPIYQKNIFFNDYSPVGANSALQPVLGRSGSFVDDNGVLRSGVEILGTRDCYPLSAKPTYEIDWGDGTPFTGSSGGFVSHNYATPGNRNIRVRLHSDDAGRNFRNGGWVSTNSPVGLNLPTTPPNIRASVYSETSGEINWDRASDDIGVVGYRIVRNGRDLGTVDALNRYEPNLLAGVYDYEIYAVDTQGGQSKTPATIELVLGPIKPPLPDPDPEPDPDPQPDPDPEPDPDPQPDPDPEPEPEPKPDPFSGAPSAPPELRAVRYSATSGEIMWQAATDRDGHITGYRIVRNGQDLGTFDTKSRYEPNLSTGTYQYQIYAIDNNGNQSNPATVTLKI